ncbi:MULTISPECIES: hypothetical protein [Nocardia]|uniref:hypothetical protein n=1 Tax=Nocardia TaxID=1817 RepID=UPI000BF0F2E2|nr:MULTISPECIES: hypothetical protein [Nocardia]MBF6184622.1 hypothetical protein [Nocardia farcinica]MBF6310466.1 hypothetical protein [Nocardia farcinica]MBF6405715.1 hypothetical protein [Nocardia farcinica]PEH75370.1 hypothetical protein CRM89_04660 [Nocardia sp. FDAARGOS_372]UEX24935.1 hypothetical protein LMJ57_10940 [Nocardia farcinica]
MRVHRFAATTLLAIGATTFAAGTVHAAPAAPEIAGVEQGIGFTAGPTTDGTGLVTRLDSGTFRAVGDAVVLTDAAGLPVAAVPATVQVDGAAVTLSPRISDAGRTLTLTPVGAPAASERLASFVDQDETLARKQHNAGVGALIGAGIGAVFGFFLGGVGALVTVPIGAGIGALIGFATP